MLPIEECLFGFLKLVKFETSEGKLVAIRVLTALLEDLICFIGFSLAQIALCE